MRVALHESSNETLYNLKEVYSLEEVMRLNLVLDRQDDANVLIHPPPPKIKGRS